MDSISTDDATLLTAEGAFEFLFEQLEKIDSILSLELQIQLKVEINIRRQKTLVSLLKFLTNPKAFKEDVDKTSFFAMAPKKDVFALVGNIWAKYFATEPTDNCARVPQQTEEESAEVEAELSMGDLLGKSIGKRTMDSSQASTSNTTLADKAILAACQDFKATGVMHPFLKKILDALLLIKPTSIKNERNFSLSSNFLSLKRKQMVCGTLDDLCFLKSYYLGQENKRQRLPRRTFLRDQKRSHFQRPSEFRPIKEVTIKRRITHSAVHGWSSQNHSTKKDPLDVVVDVRQRRPRRKLR